ncbi:hypothetical protein NGR_c33210 [Sinorhizobium fredii NGR234]|uniref:Uncharacterized protein n=1 Tax=Sinorhizobium fredii (strain NBRC 101917 / NGR234) TaxID=394 RepID=C3MAQ8_SINFN|nr:hypothetical protein NGR_c33210 [Sinorhizobium fredii NGR234]
MGRQVQRSDGRIVRSHLVSSFAAALTGFSTRVKPPAPLRPELPASARVLDSTPRPIAALDESHRTKASLPRARLF